MRKKISIIGAGNVGASTALSLAGFGIFDIALVDIIEGMPAGKALDIQQAGAIQFSDSRIQGGTTYHITAGSEIVIITAGLPRLPGMTRDDLLQKNAETIATAVRSVLEFSPNPLLIVVSNPLDAMCHVALKTSQLPSSRVIGMAGILDSARFRTFIALELGVSVRNVDALVLGGHGDTMVPLPRLSTVAGVPITELLPPERIQALVERTRNGGTEIVGLLKSGGAYYAPSAAVVEMVRDIVFDEHKILPCSALLQGEYGIEGVYVGVPVVLGSEGLDRIVELKLLSEELQALHRSAEAVRTLRNKVVH
ncbi:MAG: malate dehydrogenase [Acidobacteria bacterium]|nr:malate dehydrogenase [Acidobacteriota bacterium]